MAKSWKHTQTTRQAHAWAQLVTYGISWDTMGVNGNAWFCLGFTGDNWASLHGACAQKKPHKSSHLIEDIDFLFK